MKVKPSQHNLNSNLEDNASVVAAESYEKNRGVYSPDDYKNPEKKNKTWCSYMEQGFRASREISEKFTVHSEGGECTVSDKTAGEALQIENKTV